MKLKTAYSVNSDVKSAAGEIKDSFSKELPEFVLYFASSNYNAGLLAAEMHNSFPGSKVIGCTTAGEIVSGKMLKNSIVAMAFGKEVVDDMEVAYVEDVNNLKASLAKVEVKFGRKLNELEYDRYFGLVLVDGMGGIEEKLMDSLGNLTDIIFIGGSAGDDLKFSSTALFNGAEVKRKGALLAVIKSKVKFGFIKTQSFKVLNKKLKATMVNEQNREVIEFNNTPAVEYYAGLVGGSVEDVHNHFMDHPVGLVIGNDPYVRSPQQVTSTGLKFYCNIQEGMELNLLETGDIIADTHKAIDDYQRENGPVSGLINFNCILRTLELQSKGLCDEYGRIFSSIPTIGFSTYGEEYLGHVNQTATILAIS